MVPTINQIPRKPIYICLDLGCKVVIWTNFSTHPKSVEFHWCEWMLSTTLGLCWGNSCEWRRAAMRTSQPAAAQALVRLSLLEEDTAQSSGEPGRAARGRTRSWSAERVMSLGFSTCLLFPSGSLLFTVLSDSRKHQGISVYCKILICSQEYQRLFFKSGGVCRPKKSKSWWSPERKSQDLSLTP